MLPSFWHLVSGIQEFYDSLYIFYLWTSYFCVLYLIMYDSNLIFQPNLLSAHRSFINKVDCVELTDVAGGKGSSVTLFIFSDSLEVCTHLDLSVCQNIDLLVCVCPSLHQSAIYNLIKHLINQNGCLSTFVCLPPFLSVYLPIAVYLLSVCIC